MFVRVVLCLVTFAAYHVSGQRECSDLQGRQIAHGLHYVPGPDTCTLCICDNGMAKVCKAVLCSPPQDCRSFRVGSTCCEFICLDDVVKPGEGTETNIRVAACGAVLLVVIGIALIVYRVRKQKITRTAHTDDQRSMTSIGYISGSMGYMGGTCETALGAWKPPGHYLPRGEAPPPYDEAVAQSREHNRARASMEQYHRSYPTLDAPNDQIQCAAGHFSNLPRSHQQMANPQACFTAPLLQSMPSEGQSTFVPHHVVTANGGSGFPRALRLTGSLGAIGGRALSVPRDVPLERPRHLPPYYARSPALHRTIPRISTAVDATIIDAPLGFSRSDRSGVPCEVRRSFHKPAERLTCDTGRSMPRNLNLASFTPETSTRRVNGQVHAPPSQRVNGEVLAPDPVQAVQSTFGAEPRPPTTPAPTPTLPLTVDKPSCGCSYEGTSAPGAGDSDDYRSECENCKSASSSRWVLEEPWPDEEETQTLQRRAPPPAPPPPATATLPQRVTKQPRLMMGPPSNWENWFNTIPDSDTESEDD